ncbi:hypothetical protein C8Q78DRAFT_692752 [Trametes maxima]|nr:hypothetical protein C8Q78DRAFT_692752 [Trametes maxima]
MSETQTADFEKALSALRLLRKTCLAAIDALQEPLSPTQTSLLDSPPSCAVLHEDFQSLLTLVYTSTTKLTLVLRPSAPAPSAALAPIADLGTSITSLATCATLFDLHGTTLSSYARQTVRDICGAINALVSTFVDDAGAEYLVRTGAVHDLVEKARRDLPADNLAAVKKRWKVDWEMLEDSLGEINCMIEDGALDDGGDLDDEEDVDDEWDELGFGSSKKMSEVELERTKKVQPLIRFATLLHKRVVPDVLAKLPGCTADSRALIAALDAVPPVSHATVLALEEVVASLYAPQKPATLASAVVEFTGAIRKLHASVVTETLIPSEEALVRAMGTLDVGGENKEKAKDPRKWFSTCLMQIDKSAKVFEELLAPDIANAT